MALIPTRSARSLLGIALLAATSALAQGPPPANVRVADVKLEPVREQRLITGQVEPAKRTLLTTQERGQVVEAPPEPGTPVKQGQIIARLDDELLQIDRAAAQADVAEAQATVAERQAELDLRTRDRTRIAELLKSNVARPKELEDAQDQEAAAKARLALAQAQLTAAQTQLQRLDKQIANTRIAAPFDGYVVRKHTEVGQWVDPGNPVAELVMTSGVKVRLDVPEAMVAHIPRAEPLDLEVVGLATTVCAEVFSIVPDADPQARTFRVLFKVDNPDGKLMPGLSVRAHLPTGQTMQGLTVPKDAVQITPAGSVVYANRGGAAAQVPVIVRFPAGDRFVIDAALRPGEQVVIEGNGRLAPGQPLNITEVRAAEATGEAPVNTPNQRER